MSDYRWITNVRTPIEPVDERLMEALGDCKLGAPMTTPSSKPLPWLREHGFRGLYTTIEAINAPLPARLTGWGPQTADKWAKAPKWKE